MAPSMVLPGLTRGANLRLPKARPAKYAAISATQTRARRDTTNTAPRATYIWARTAQAANAAGTEKTDQARLAGGASERPRTTAVTPPNSQTAETAGTR